MVSPNFHGKKGRSGRKNFPTEQAKINVIKNSWRILDERLDKVNDLDIALPIALKDMTEKSDVVVTLPKPILDLQNVSSNNNDNQDNTDGKAD